MKICIEEGIEREGERQRGRDENMYRGVERERERDENMYRGGGER